MRLIIIILDFDFFYSPSCIRQPSALPGGCSLSLAEERREKKDISAFPTKKQFRSRKASSKLAIGIVTPMELGECRRRRAAAVRVYSGSPLQSQYHAKTNWFSLTFRNVVYVRRKIADKMLLLVGTPLFLLSFYSLAAFMRRRVERLEIFTASPVQLGCSRCLLPPRRHLCAAAGGKPGRASL